MLPFNTLVERCIRRALLDFRFPSLTFGGVIIWRQYGARESLHGHTRLFLHVFVHMAVSPSMPPRPPRATFLLTESVCLV
jgi:hypothetical protein